MRDYKVSLTWVLFIVAGTVLGASSLAAVTRLGDQSNALAVTIAGDVVCSQCVGTNGDGTNDIKDGSVTNAKIASSAVTSSKIGSSAVTNAKIAGNAVTSSKIADGTIATADIHDGAITAAKISANAIIHRTLLDDATGNSHGWNPNGNKTTFVISDPAFNVADSTVLINLKDGSTGFDTCSVDFRTSAPSFEIHCAVDSTNTPATPPDNGSQLDYVIITRPATAFSAATAASSTSSEPTPRGE